MAQVTTISGYNTNVAAAFRQVGYGFLAAWQRVVNPSVNFFTIGTSTIGGGDFIKSGGAFVTFFDKYLYTDYSRYVMTWSVQRQIGQYPYGVIMAQADVQLDNTSNLFLPGYDATIGSGILPNRPMKLSVSIGQESLSQFVGFTTQPDINIVQRQMTLHAYDAMDFVQKAAFTTSGTVTSGINTTTSGWFANQRSDQIMSYYLQQMGFSSNQFVLDQGLQSPISYMSVMDRKFGNVLADLVAAEQGLMFVDETGIIRFWNRQHFLTTSGTLQFALNYSNLMNLEYENAPIINDVMVQARPRAVESNQLVYNLGTTFLIGPGQTVSTFADFADQYGTLPVTSVTTPTGNGASSTYQANTAQDGSGTDVTANVSIVGVYLFGTSYKMTFRNNGVSNAYITTLNLYGTPARVHAVIQQRYLDQTSIDTYGRNPANNGDPIVISNDYIQDSSAAYSLAYTLVNEYKIPRRRYKATVFALPHLQIGDYGTVTVPDSGETKYVFLVGGQIQMSQDAQLGHILWLEERLPQSYFTIGTSQIAGADTIAP